jgi:hypothetical protein
LRESELMMLSGAMIAGFSAMVISSPGYVMPYQRMFWVYVAIAAKLALWAREMQLNARGRAQLARPPDRTVRPVGDTVAALR